MECDQRRRKRHDGDDAGQAPDRASGQAPKGAGLTVERIYTTAGVHPYDEVTWERRDVVMTNWRDGSINFEQRGVEFPDFWSVNATNIVTTKYFRGAVGTEAREWSLKQLIDRVVKTYRAAGDEHGYFAPSRRRRGLRARADVGPAPPGVLVQLPGVVQRRHVGPQQVSACFILAVDDTMDSILNWYREEGLIFKGGSGAGLNLSRIRSSKELLSSGGTASGPVSFMRGADASAGTIKSGGATRRAAKMVVLDVDHPDIEEFVETKAREEDKIRALRDAGFDMDLGGKDITSVQYQNANNSVRVTDEFMRAVEEGAEFGLTARADRRGHRDRRRRSCSQDRPGRVGSAPTPASSTTTRSTTGTPTPRRAASPHPTRASEYMSLDNSSCNLASLNLMKFLSDDDTFDADASPRSSSSSSRRWTSRSASPTSRPRRSATRRASTASSASATPTSARC